MRFDAVARIFEVSVRELAADDSFHRIGFTGTEVWTRFGLGTQIHTRVLGARRESNTSYRSEVHLQLKIPVGEWTAILTGRLDGCCQNSTGEWLIEEVKSGYFGNVRPTGPVTEQHRRQLLIYCDLWRQLGHTPVNGALVYVDVISNSESVVPVRYHEKEHGDEVQTRLQALLKSWKAREKLREQKATIAACLPFPHAVPRPGQQQLMARIQEALRQNENLLAEAPTGSGKTAASLHPALAEGLRAGKQVVFLTAKTLQQDMAVKAFKGMNHQGVFRTLQMRAKEKMCANGEVICHEDICPYAKSFPQKMERSRLLDRLRATQTHHDPEAVFTAAKREQVCPFEVQLELASRADAIVADYNYVFDPGTALKHLDDLNDTYLVIDEAHNLPDRARRIFSPELHEEVFRRAIGYLDELTPEVMKNLRAEIAAVQQERQAFLFPDDTETDPSANVQLFQAVRDNLHAVVALLEQCAVVLEGQMRITEIQPPTEALRNVWKEWEPVFVRYALWKRENKLVQADDAIVEAHFTLQRMVTMLNFFGPGFSCVVERGLAGGGEGLSIRLALVCLDPMRPLTPSFESAASTILLSATLSPAEMTRRTLGLAKDRTSALRLPPPFPRENRKIMILPQVRTTYEARTKNFPRIGELIQQMSDAVPGNTLVLFPSYEFLKRVAEVLPPTKAKLVAQRPSLPEIERQKILKTLSVRSQNTLLFAVLGGMYAEGVDYPGELLSAVFVVSPALPQVSFERELLRRYFDENESAGFNYAYLNPGMTRVVQAAGRLIRSETDRGVIALICQRFLQEPYAGCLPADWYGDSPLELVVKDPASEIRNFFRERGAA